MEDFWTVKEMFMMDNLKIIMLKDLEDIYQKEEQLTLKEIGTKINSMALEKKYGKIASDMKVLTFKGKKTERVSCDFQMEDIMKEISLIIYIMAMENSSNLINFMKGTEYLIKWKDMGDQYGSLLDMNTQANSKIIKGMEMELLNGQMEENIQEVGKMVK